MNYSTSKQNHQAQHQAASTAANRYSLPYLQVNFVLMSNNKVDLGGQKLGIDGNRVGTGNRAGADLEGNKVGASAMDKVDLDSGTEADGSDGDAQKTKKGGKSEKSGDASGNKLIDWKIDFDAAGGAIEDRKDEVDHLESETYEADRRSSGTLLNDERTRADRKQTDTSKSVILFSHDSNGIVWPGDSYRSLRDVGMGRLLALLAVLVIHFSLSYRTMESLIPDPRLPVRLKKRKLL